MGSAADIDFDPDLFSESCERRVLTKRQKQKGRKQFWRGVALEPEPNWQLLNLTPDQLRKLQQVDKTLKQGKKGTGMTLDIWQFLHGQRENTPKNIAMLLLACTLS